MKIKPIVAWAVVHSESGEIEVGDLFAELDCPASSGSESMAVFERPGLVNHKLDKRVHKLIKVRITPIK